MQKHLLRVYATLSAALVLAAVGCAVDMTYHIGGLLTWIVSFGALVGLGMSTTTPATLVSNGCKSCNYACMMHAYMSTQQCM